MLISPEPLPSLPIVGQGVRMREFHFLLSGAGCENTPCQGVWGPGGWRSGCFCAVCRLGSHTRTLTCIHRTQGEPSAVVGYAGEPSQAPFCTPGFMARSCLFPEMGLTQCFPAACLLCCAGLWEGLLPPGWLWFSSLGSVLRIPLVASPLTLLPGGGLLFSTPVFPQIMRVRVPDSEEGLRAALWKGGREGGSKLIPIWLS